MNLMVHLSPLLVDKKELSFYKKQSSSLKQNFRFKLLDSKIKNKVKRTLCAIT